MILVGDGKFFKRLDWQTAALASFVVLMDGEVCTVLKDRYQTQPTPYTFPTSALNYWVRMWMIKLRDTPAKAVE
jgi:hypothetical protein